MLILQNEGNFGPDGERSKYVGGALFSDTPV